MNRTSTQFISSSKLSGKLNISPINSYRDFIEINSVLYPNLLTNSIGSLNKELIQTQILKLNINSTIYSNSLSTVIDQSLGGNEIIEVKLEELYFPFNQEDFAYANIVFEFNNFNLVIIYKNSQSYIDFGFTTNSSDSRNFLIVCTDRHLWETITICASEIIRIKYSKSNFAVSTAPLRNSNLSPFPLPSLTKVLCGTSIIVLANFCLSGRLILDKRIASSKMAE